jgi:hypothetical protein
LVGITVICLWPSGEVVQAVANAKTAAAAINPKKFNFMGFDATTSASVVKLF